VCGADDKPLWQIQKVLASKKYIDLTHEFAPGIPRWPGFPDETRKTIYWYEKRPDTKGSGFFSELFTHVGHWGTHVDPPAHFIKGLRTVDQIDPKEMILPLVVIDVHQEAAKNPDYTLSTNRAVERAACASGLEQLIWIDVDCHGDVFGEGQLVDGLTHEAAQAHDGFAADQNVKAELALQFFKRRRRCVA